MPQIDWSQLENWIRSNANWVMPLVTLGLGYLIGRLQEQKRFQHDRDLRKYQANLDLEQKQEQALRFEILPKTNDKILMLQAKLQAAYSNRNELAYVQESWRDFHNYFLSIKIYIDAQLDAKLAEYDKYSYGIVTILATPPPLGHDPDYSKAMKEANLLLFNTCRPLSTEISQSIAARLKGTSEN